MPRVQRQEDGRKGTGAGNGAHIREGKGFRLRCVSVLWCCMGASKHLRTSEGVRNEKDCGLANEGH